MMDEEKSVADLDYARSNPTRSRLDLTHHIPTYVTIFATLAFCLLLFTGYQLLSWYLRCERIWPLFSWPFTILLIATVLGGISGIRQRTKRKTELKPTFVTYLSFGSGTLVVLLLLLAIFYNPFYELTFENTQGSHELGMRRVCAANMRGIGYAILIYQQDFGAAPVAIEDIFRTDPAARKQLICPSYQNNPAAYRLVKQCPPNKDGLVPVLIEDPRNHWCAGGNVLYDDFMTVEFLDKAEFDKLIQSASFE